MTSAANHVTVRRVPANGPRSRHLPVVYPRGVPGKPTEPPRNGELRAPAPAEPAGGAPEALERCGPVVVERLSKEDGRALLALPQRPGPAVSELRFNELRGEQVAYAIDRQERTFLPSRAKCPLCPTRPGGPETEIPVPAFEIAVFDNRFPAFEAPHGAAEVVVYTDDHDASFGTLAAGAGRGADVGLAPSLLGARRARGHRLRVHLREPRRGGRRHPPPSARADLRVPVPAARARARARRRRAAGRMRAVRAARRGSSPTAAG